MNRSRPFPRPPSAQSLEHAALAEWLSHAEADQLFDAARQLFCNEAFEDSAAIFSYLLAFRTRAASVWLWLGACQEALQRFDLAAQTYAAAHVACPDDCASEIAAQLARVTALVAARPAGDAS
jgi:tetratricopeptide (TPR) repeat protein